MNLLAKIEAEIREVSKEMQSEVPFAQNVKFKELKERKEKLKKLAFDYVSIENQFKQLTALTSA